MVEYCGRGVSGGGGCGAYMWVGGGEGGRGRGGEGGWITKYISWDITDSVCKANTD